jgi:hypothetical protein
MRALYARGFQCLELIHEFPRESYRLPVLNLIGNAVWLYRVHLWIRKSYFSINDDCTISNFMQNSSKKTIPYNMLTRRKTYCHTPTSCHFILLQILIFMLNETYEWFQSRLAGKKCLDQFHWNFHQSKLIEIGNKPSHEVRFQDSIWH